MYPGVGHSFMNQADLNPVIEKLGEAFAAAGYDERAAGDAWERVLAFFDEYV